MTPEEETKRSNDAKYTNWFVRRNYNKSNSGYGRKRKIVSND